MEVVRNERMKPEQKAPEEAYKTANGGTDVTQAHSVSESEDIRLLLLRIRAGDGRDEEAESDAFAALDRKSTRLNSSH